MYIMAYIYQKILGLGLTFETGSDLTFKKQEPNDLTALVFVNLLVCFHILESSLIGIYRVELYVANYKAIDGSGTG